MFEFLLEGTKLAGGNVKDANLVLTSLFLIIYGIFYVAFTIYEFSTRVGLLNTFSFFKTSSLFFTVIAIQFLELYLPTFLLLLFFNGEIMLIMMIVYLIVKAGFFVVENSRVRYCIAISAYCVQYINYKREIIMFNNMYKHQKQLLTKINL